MKWNGLDVVIIILIIYSLIQGLARGFIRVIISMVALVAGLILAAHYYPQVAPWFSTWVKSPEIASFVAFVAIFGVVKFCGLLVAFLLGRLIAAVHLEWFDRLFGGFLGAFKGFLIGAVIYFALLAFPFEFQWVKNAALAPYLTRGAQWLSHLTPPDVKAKFQGGLDRMREKWQETKPRAGSFFPAG